MLYAILCYDSEDAVGAWTPEEEARVMGRLQAVEAGLAAKGQLGPVARLLPTTAATTVRKGKEPLVLDGPFAETKEQLLGFFILDLPDLDAALAAAKDLALANSGGSGGYEVRPLLTFKPNGLEPEVQVATGFHAPAGKRTD
ncbi:YciI family protein [Marinibaculum pumilum]|uniref:YciI family protein n=1 Tax=Marinibaculum pumilum TaxID=1766165 RepID=A0ABV7L7P9_9PROT